MPVKGMFIYHPIYKLFQTDNFMKHLKIKTVLCFDTHVNICTI